MEQEYKARYAAYIEKIEAYLKSYNLPYEQVFNKCDGKMQVIVYQYSTLYMETFIIHRTRDLQ